MNIAIAKIGKSIKFRNSTWGATGGPNEAPVFFQSIARLNPDTTFYLIGKNDYSRLTYEERLQVTPHNNIVDLWQYYKKDKDNHITFIHDYITKNNIQIDCGLIYAGSVAGVNIPNLVKKKDKDEFVGVLETYKNYAAPIVDYLNKSGIKYITLCPDPRYVPLRAEDILNVERISLTLFDGVVKVPRMVSFEDQNTYVEHEVVCKYTGIETAYLMDDQFSYEDNNKMDYDKTRRLVIFHNEGGLKDLYRGKVLKEYVLDAFPDVEIWGKWKDKWLETDKRFKGEIKFNELQEMLSTVKYTFMVPIERDTLSMKFWECINQGIIPFMHPYYDESRYINCPEILRITDPADLKNKIDFLDNNPDEYYKLLKTLKDMITPEMYDGRFMNKHVMEAIEELKNM